MRHPFLWPVYALCASLVFIVVVGQSREGSRPPGQPAQTAPVTPLAAVAVPPTRALAAPTRTPVPTAAPTIPPTATPRPDPAQAEYLDPRELAAEPKAHVGKNIILQGKALNVEHKDASRGVLSTTEPHTWINLMASVRGRQGTTESIVIELYPKETKVLKDDCYQIRGVVAGTQKVRRLLTGAENEVPVIRAYDWQAVPSGQFGLCPTL